MTSFSYRLGENVSKDNDVLLVHEWTGRAFFFA
jgi:hypothetical protein